MKHLGLVLVACLTLGGGIAAAQAVNCAGISDVSLFDGPMVTDMAGRLDAVRVASGLTRPVFAASPPNDLHRLFIVEQDGRIRILKDGALLAAPFLDLSALTLSPSDGGGGEQGLLGLAFHPGYAQNGWFFVYHTDLAGDNRVARYTRGAGDPDLADAASRAEVITLIHPAATNHNGGMLAFGPDDGYLYIGTGDGGGSCDADGNAQNTGSRLGKILRLDVDALPYSIPPDNPFAGGPASDDELWALGLRNPWRFSFDRATGALYIGDVGQNQREEVNCRAATSAGGENYGWDLYEGTACPNPSCGAQGPSCVLAGYVPPVQEYPHTEGCSITGGYVYRGCRMGDLRGHYFYSDFCSAFIRSFRTDAACAAPAYLDRTADLAPGGGLTIATTTSFGEDARGELYIVDLGGEVFKIVPHVPILEVSGLNAVPLRLTASDWAWEDLAASSGQPIAAYKVYRAIGDPTGPFLCVHQTAVPAWPGGDGAAPAGGEALFYLITGVDTTGQETRPGYHSDGTGRAVDTASTCPL